MILSRRGVLRCLTGIIAAPAVIKADALMRVVRAPQAKWRMFNSGRMTAEEIELLIRPPLLGYFETMNELLADMPLMPSGLIRYRTSLPLASWRKLSGAAIAAEHGAERGVSAADRRL